MDQRWGQVRKKRILDFLARISKVADFYAATLIPIVFRLELTFHCVFWKSSVSYEPSRYKIRAYENPPHTKDIRIFLGESSFLNINPLTK